MQIEYFWKAFKWIKCERVIDEGQATVQKK